MKVEVLMAYESGRITEKINELIDKGWKRDGALIVTPFGAGGSIQYTQVMTKIEAAAHVCACAS